MARHLYTADIAWDCADRDAFDRGHYTRGHTWSFDAGMTLHASASPSVVPLPFSREDAIDPEEALVAAIASCHMLTFLDIAAKAGFTITSYRDKAVGKMGKFETGGIAVTQVTLNPQIIFAGPNRPNADTYQDLHHKAHVGCFIANSVKTEITLDETNEPLFAD